jgi:hypothetical protein
MNKTQLTSVQAQFQKMTITEVEATAELDQASGEGPAAGLYSRPRHYKPEDCK